MRILYLFGDLLVFLDSLTLASLGWLMDTQLDKITLSLFYSQLLKAFALTWIPPHTWVWILDGVSGRSVVGANPTKKDPAIALIE